MDEAVYDFDSNSTTIDLDRSTDIETQEIIDQQLQQLDQSPGKMMYRQWVEKEVANDKVALEKLLRDPKAREAYAKQMHLAMSEIEPSGITSLPNEVFMSVDPIDQQQGPDQGNLSGLYSRLARILG